MIDGPWFITPHAVQRYIERCRPRASYEEALHELVELSRGAVRKKTLESGAELWRGPKPLRLRMVVDRGNGGAPQLVTVRPLYRGGRRAY